jgi:prepilin-type N-terminal cleavage/methylation domain-containing protein
MPFQRAGVFVSLIGPNSLRSAIMKVLHRRATAARRGGVTLVELLVAISVIALLAGLTFICFHVGHRAADNVTNQVSAVNPKAARQLRSSVPMKPSTIIPNQYVVAFDNSVTNPQAAATQLAKTVPATVLHVYTSAFKGCAVRIQPGQLPQLQAAANVSYIAPDQTRAFANVMPTGISRVRFVNAPVTPPYRLFMPPLPHYAPLGSSTGGGGINSR